MALEMFVLYGSLVRESAVGPGQDRPLMTLLKERNRKEWVGVLQNMIMKERERVMWVCI